MLKRLAEKGYPVDFDALDAPFNLTITPVFSSDADGELIIFLSQRVRKLVRESGVKYELNDILIFLCVLNPEIKSKKDRSSWNSASCGYTIRRNIDFPSWQKAKLSEKKAILKKYVIEAIEAIPTKRLSEASKAALSEIIREATS